MAWRVTGLALRMAVGDYGIDLPVTISGVTFGEGDAIRFTFNSGLGLERCWKRLIPLSNTTL